jgi:hypothetical protein
LLQQNFDSPSNSPNFPEKCVKNPTKHSQGMKKNIPILDKSAVERILGNTNIDAKKK